MKQGPISFVEELLDTASLLVQKHPKRLVAAVTAMLACATGATFAVANLGPDAATVVQRQIAESVTPLSAVAQLTDNGIQTPAMRMPFKATVRMA